MNDGLNFESDLRPSARLIAWMLVVFALALTLTTETWPLPPRWFELQIEILFFYGLAVLVWLADRWSPNVSRWTAAVGLSVLVNRNEGVIPHLCRASFPRMIVWRNVTAQ